MPIFPLDSLDSLPISIKRVTTPTSKDIEITLTMSRELAEQLTLLAAPLMRDLAQAVECQKCKDDERLRQLELWRNEKKQATLIGLRAIRVMRKQSLSLDDAVNRLSMRHDIRPEQLRITIDHLQRQRRQRLERFRNLAICRLYQADMQKSRIAERFGVSVWVVNRVLEQYLPTLHPQLTAEAVHG